MNTSEIIPQLFEAIDSKDTSSFVSYITEDCAFIFGNAPAVIGKDAIFQAVQGFFDSIVSLSHNLEDICEAGNLIISRGIVTYTRHNGSKLQANFCNVFNMRSELIERYQIYIDVSQLYI